MTSDDRTAWRKLGADLIARRIALNPRWRTRTTFAQEVGLDYRTVSDIETGRRSNYSKSTLRAVEHAYQLEAGTLDRRARPTLEVAQPDEIADMIEDLPEEEELAGRQLLVMFQALQKEVADLRQKVRRLEESQPEADSDVTESEPDKSDRRGIRGA